MRELYAAAALLSSLKHDRESNGLSGSIFAPHEHKEWAFGETRASCGDSGGSTKLNRLIAGPRGDRRRRVRWRRLSSEKATAKNRRLFSFSFRFLNRPSEKRAECAHLCAQTMCPKRVARRRYKAVLWLHLASKATFSQEKSPSPLRCRAVPCKCLCTYTCRCAVRWPRG